MKKLSLTIPLMIAICLLASTARADTPITDCQIISSSGHYNLQNDIVAHDMVTYYVFCIDVQASNVDIDMGGYTIIGNSFYGGGSYPYDHWIDVIGIRPENADLYNNLSVHNGIISHVDGTVVANVANIYDMVLPSDENGFTMDNRQNPFFIGNVILSLQTTSFAINIDNTTGTIRGLSISQPLHAQGLNFGSLSHDINGCEVSVTGGDYQITDSGINNNITSDACPPLTTTTTTTTTTIPLGPIAGALTMVGEGSGNLLTSLGGPVTTLLILLGFVAGVTILFGKLSKGFGED